MMNNPLTAPEALLKAQKAQEIAKIEQKREQQAEFDKGMTEMPRHLNEILLEIEDRAKRGATYTFLPRRMFYFRNDLTQLLVKQIKNLGYKVKINHTDVLVRWSERRFFN